jgi:hypothetical protein
MGVNSPKNGSREGNQSHKQAKYFVKGHLRAGKKAKYFVKGHLRAGKRAKYFVKGHLRAGKRAKYFAKGHLRARNWVILAMSGWIWWWEREVWVGKRPFPPRHQIFTYCKLLSS